MAGRLPRSGDGCPAKAASLHLAGDACPRGCDMRDLRPSRSDARRDRLTDPSHAGSDSQRRTSTRRLPGGSGAARQPAVTRRCRKFGAYLSRVRRAVLRGGTGPVFAVLRPVSSGLSSRPRGPRLSLKCASGFSVAPSEDNALAGLLQKVKAQGQRGVNKFPEKLANLFP